MSDKEKTSDTDNLTLKDFMPDVSKGYMAIAGTKLEGKSDKADEIQIIDALMEVKDPEIPVNIYDLGLIYSIERHYGGDVDITMSLTAPGCPVAGEMPGQVAEKVAELAQTNRDTINALYERATQNRGTIMSEAEKSAELREEIVTLREKISANQRRVADKIIEL